MKQRTKDEIKYGAFGHVFLGIIGLTMLGLAAMPARGVTLDTRKVERLSSYSEVTEVSPIPIRKPPVPYQHLLANAISETNALKPMPRSKIPMPTLEGVRR